MHSVLCSLYRRLVVSCQAAPNDPMDDIETLRRVARSTIRGGAKGLRLNSPELVRVVRCDTALPIIGIQKSYNNEQLRITPDFASARMLADAGANIIALDCTDQVHVHGEPWRIIARRIKEELGLLVMADIATVREGVLAAEADVDIVAPTLRGYTEETQNDLGFRPDFIRSLVDETGKPVFAEGNISTPAFARASLDAGAWCVVVGTAITRPGAIATTFVHAMQGAVDAEQADIE